MTGRGPVLTALAIIPDRELAGQLATALERTRSFQILSEFKSYPSQQTLEIRVRQTKPDVILLDLATRPRSGLRADSLRVLAQSPDARGGVARAQRFGRDSALAAERRERVSVRALRRANAERRGRPAAPSAAARDRRNKPSPVPSSRSPAPSPARAHRRWPPKRPSRCAAPLPRRVLLADFDLMGGMIGFYLKLTNTKSLLDAAAGGRAAAGRRVGFVRWRWPMAWTFCRRPKPPTPGPSTRRGCTR